MAETDSLTVAAEPGPKPQSGATLATQQLTVVMEWANTRLNGIYRAREVLTEFGRQWQLLQAREYPDDLAPEARPFLESLAPRAELLIVSGVAIDGETTEWIHAQRQAGFDVSILIEEGLEYYPLKNKGIRASTGDILVCIDSDVLPDPGWIFHLLGALADEAVEAVAGQPYIRPESLFSRAFALGWTYDRKRPGTGLTRKGKKFYANNIVFRAGAIRPGGFPDIGKATRGASTKLRVALARRKIVIWMSNTAFVAHPAPLNFAHLVERALAHGRDKYARHSEGRSWRALSYSVGAAMRRLRRGCRACIREGRSLGLTPLAQPAALAIIACYYSFFALGGLYTYLHPAGSFRRFRV